MSVRGAKQILFWWASGRVPKLPLPVLHMFESSSQQRRAREML